ncbi:MAG: DUF1926 domain-containing protein, partial [Planctomycetia bacterium]|nr:DUF1926 domain-containing protein [Planctomycetia bacterium]
DRVGQIRAHSRWIQKRLGVVPRGMWMPERVWEQSFAFDLAKSGMKFSIVDDYHFKKTGLKEENLWGYYLTEDQGEVVAIFPGSEKLRYWIPFHSPYETIDYFREIREKQSNPIIVFGDDGEKFGSWPETFKHVYEDGWLVSFFDALAHESDWVQTVSLSEALDSVPPLGKCYLPDCSYREMTEWALPARRLEELESATKDAPWHDPWWDKMRTFISGGNWRNFKVKYPETNEMYARMMWVSRRLADVERSLNGARCELVEKARLELYRGQCNCSYWHGAFGGVYLPHLRNGVYQHLIAADNLLDEALRETNEGLSPKCRSCSCDSVCVEKGDFDFDSHDEYRLSNSRSIAWIAPSKGGMLYEFDLRAREHNLLATLARREEAYHQKVRQGANQGQDDCASIHERVHFKQEGLEHKLAYDNHLRKSMIDMFFGADATCEGLYNGGCQPVVDLATRPYFALPNDDGALTQWVVLHAPALGGKSFEITLVKTFRLKENGAEIVYRLENLPQGEIFHFGAEFNFSGLPGGCDDRYFYDANGNSLGNLSSRLDLKSVQNLGLRDDWLKLNIPIALSRGADVWAYPVETVSNSEGGFESVHQSVALVFHRCMTSDDCELEISIALEYYNTSR